MGLKTIFFKEKPSRIYTQTGEKIITNTTVETSFLNGDHTGINIIPDRLLSPHSTITLRMFGLISTAGTPQTTLRFYFDGVEIIESVGILPNNLNNTYFDVFIEITIGTNKEYFNLNGRTLFQTVLGVGTPQLRGFYANNVAYTKKSEYPIDMTYQWGTASTGNTIKIYNLEIGVS